MVAKKKVKKKIYSICMFPADHKRITAHMKKIKAKSLSDYLVMVSMADIELRARLAKVKAKAKKEYAKNE